MNKEKKIIKFGCYFCAKGVDAEELAIDKEGNCIMSDNPKLPAHTNHFICKKCYEKVTNFFEVKEFRGI